MIRMGLRKKWVISITILIILLASASSSFFIGQLKINEKKHLTRHGFTLANNLAYNSEYGVLIANEKILLTLIRGVMREKDVSYCVIQDMGGNILASSGTAQKNGGIGIYEVSAPIVTKALESLQGELEFFVKPEEASEERPAKFVKIGVARVGISMASANRSMQEAQTTAIITTFIIILIGIFVTYFMVGAIVTPIRELAEGTQIVAKGDLNHRVSLNTRDEIGDLGNAFNKMTEDLKASQSQLIQAEKMEIVGRLASGIAHEVKNPLAIILQCVEYLAKNIQTEDKNVSLTLGYIKDAVQRADNVIRGLLDFSGSSRLDIKVGSLNPVIERALFLLKHQFDKYHVRIIKELGEDVPDVEMDENRMEQVFVNLFLNAVAAMPDGGQLTVMSYAQKQESKDDSVIVQVEDTGTGIPGEILGKIFDPFFTTRRDEGGTGLGLSVVKNIIELHDGKISIQNRKEGGARVTLTFKS